MFDLWVDLPTWFRALVGLILIGVGVLLFLGGGGRIAIAIGATGFVLLLFCSIGNDKSGYNF